MRKYVFALFVLFRFACLFGQMAYAPPVIGRCVAKELRIRDFPSLKEYSSNVVGSFSLGDEIIVLGRLSDTLTIDGRSSSWYAVVGMEGVIGWSFGAYIDIGTAKLRVFVGSDEDLGTVESLPSDALESEGVACRLLRGDGVLAVFAKTAKGRPQVIYLNDVGYEADPRVVGIRAVDYFGDAGKELCLEIEGGAGDSGGGLDGVLR